MSDWQIAVIQRCADLDHVIIGEGAFGPGPAVWVGKREVAHFDADSALDIRLTKSVIRARRSELATHEDVRLRSGVADWLELRTTGDPDIDFAVGLIRDAVEANLATAPPGLPPSGADLNRRRRFH